MRALQSEKSIIVPISSPFKAVVKNIDTTFWVEWYMSICNMLKTDTVLVRLVLNIYIGIVMQDIQEISI